MKLTTEQAREELLKAVNPKKPIKNPANEVERWLQALQMGADALALPEKIKDILFTHRYTDYDCVMEIAKLVGIYVSKESDN